MRHIYEAADAAQQLKYFYRQISSPLLANIKYTYPKDQVIENILKNYRKIDVNTFKCSGRRRVHHQDKIRSLLLGIRTGDSWKVVAIRCYR